ncbi:MAG: TonB-dependent receptor [Gammaproteobacteria bacterium]|nr:TonB-dependent receptor [Gammaproteobacteria bacterium]
MARIINPILLKLIFVSIAYLFSWTSVSAQVITLEPIDVTATRVEKNLTEIPSAVSNIGRDDIQLGAEQLGLDESLNSVPGLFLMNRYNFAQDLRASIRGFGARSAFGIRGIKVIVDGIPETLPDGQGSVDGIDIGSVEQITVIRGPASSLYGNASGGAIIVESERGPPEPFTEIRSTGGEHGLQKHQLKFGGQSGDLNYMVNVSDTRTDGYRDHSEAENRQFNTRLEADLSQNTTVVATLHHTDQPVANDPGGINATSVEANRRQARDRNLMFNTGETLRQNRFGLMVRTELTKGHSLQARVHHIDREFDASLPIPGNGIIRFDRNVLGTGLQYTWESSLGSKPNRFLMGLDIDRQDDDRSRFQNKEGGIAGARVLDQNEEVTSLGVFLQNETRITDRSEFTVGLRYDEVKYDVTDRFINSSNGDDSGNITFDQVSPMVGLSFALTEDVRLYSNISSGFETPTTTELANPILNEGGFDQTLEPQESTNYEIGIKSLTGKHRYEVALFSIDIRNELNPYEPKEQEGRTFYRNAGESSREGIELSYATKLGHGFEFASAFTWSDFKFDRFSNEKGNVFDGKQIPGIPEHFLYLGLTWFGKNGHYLIWNANLVGSLYADNANQTKVDGYTVSNLRFGQEKFIGDWEISPFIGVNNLFDEEYNSNIRINAFGSRFYEPAPERNFYGGISVRRVFGG